MEIASLVLTVLAAIVVLAGIGFFLKDVALPHHRNTDLRSRLADSHWLAFGTMALAMIMVGGTTITIGWLGWPFTAILVLIVGQFVALGVAFPVMKWASNYEDARMERERAEWVAKIKAMKAAAKATTEDEEE